MKSKLNYKQGAYIYMITFFLFIAVNIALALLNLPWIRKNSTLTLIPKVIINESIIVVPMLIFLISKGENIKKTLRFNKISLKQIGLCLILFFCALFISAFCGTLTIFICKLFRLKYTAQSIPAAKQSTELFLSIIFVAMVPAFCEDLFFRGFMLSSCKKNGMKFGVICTAFCFALMHTNASIFLSIFSIGIILALAVYYTDSIFAGVIIHFCNNAFSTVMAFALPYIIAYLKAHSKDTNVSAGKAINQVNSEPITTTLGSLITIGVLAVGAGLVAYLVISKLKKIWIENGGLEKEKEVVAEKLPIYKMINIPMLGAIALFVITLNLHQIFLMIKSFIR